MQVTWLPEDGGDKQTWQFDPDDVEGERAEQIEEHYDGTYDQWVAALQIGQIKARRILLWHMLTHVHPSLKFTDVPKFRVRQIKVEMGVAELVRLAERVQRLRLPKDQKEKFRLQMEADLADAFQREGRSGTFDFHDDGSLWVSDPVELPKAVSAGD